MPLTNKAWSQHTCTTNEGYWSGIRVARRGSVLGGIQEGTTDTQPSKTGLRPFQIKDVGRASSCQIRGTGTTR